MAELKRSGGEGSLLGWWRTRLRRFLLLRLPPRLRGYMSAALLGVRDPELEERHRRWGTVHLLAVSGFHVGLIAVVFRKIFRNVPLAPAWVSACIWFYTLMTGAAPSALRAALMIEAMILAGWIGRPQSPVHS
ncbi:MAG: ComEC/Rec2 family competence protein, partial [Chloroflexi bacterium]|nr:ComEC/Rec2 family competence protein [Chloroflexota bacterium]